ncbi:MAG: hypothetical protein PHD48_00770 [Alphaproteobacteria bacterium]|nr:hypothetical protein [Alphaproteobacteria bacterium]
MFNLNDTLSIKINGKTVEGKLIGIDSYLMDGFDGNRHKWKSYTLVSDREGPFSRYWITERETGWFLSTAAKKVKPPKNAKVFPARSGIARIDFKGDKGVSTPAAALLAHKVGPNKFFTVERFLDSEIMFFDGQKIAKPKCSGK